ncbi:MAG: hypothetical protein PHC35_08865 [Deltaproteobacteria bacterium]|jgi:hypothetical protein|nr:hypothetical protein [Deltaproteobacteria bacterium]
MKRLFSQMTAHLERLMTAVTFAEAGEPDEARRFLNGSCCNNPKTYKKTQPELKRLVAREV